MKNILIAFFLLTGVVAYGQQPVINKTYAFSQPIAFGNPPAEEVKIKNNDVQYFAYVEFFGRQFFEVNGAWINGRYYTVTTSLINESTISVGESAAGKKVVVNRNGNYQIMQLFFTKSNQAKKIPASYRSRKTGTVLLKLTTNNKTSYHLVKSITRLKPNLSIQ